MNFTLQQLQEILLQYNLNQPIINNEVCLEENTVDEAGPKLKKILRLTLSDHSSWIMKITREKYNYDHIEQQCRFSEQLRIHGIPTAQKMQTGKKHCLIYEGFHVTLEKDCGISLNTVNKNIAKEAGSLLGKLHHISEKHDLHLPNRTIFDFLHYNEVDGSTRFYEFVEKDFLQHEIIKRIRSSHNHLIHQYQYLENHLPAYAVQGDFSLSNLCYQDNQLTVFDYNIAGEAILVADMVLQGLLICHEFACTDSHTPEQLFQFFLEGYLEQRALSKEERLASDLIYRISEAFWFTLIDYRSHSLNCNKEEIEFHLSRIEKTLKQKALNF